MPWRFERSHSAIKESDVQNMAEKVVIGFLLSSLEGGWDVSDELNQAFPDYEFAKMEDFLSKVWDGKP